MFSWSKKKETKRRGRRGEESSEENEFGIKLDKGPSDKQLEAELKALAGVDELPDDELNLNEGEDDVESELLRLIGKKDRKPARKQASEDGGQPVDIMADITAEIDLGDEDVEVDENDPDLLGELLELTQPDDMGGGSLEDEEEESEGESEAKPQGGEADILSVLKERLKMYKTAEMKAKENNESSRARRFGRGIKTIEDLIKKAKAGKPVSPNDIPTVIAMNLKPAPVQPEVSQEDGDGRMAENEESQPFSNGEEPSSASQGPSDDSPTDVLSTLFERLKMYQTAEAKAKEAGETTRARRFGRGIKTIQDLIKQAKAGKPVSATDIPPAVALNLKPPPPPSEEINVVDSEEVENEMENVNLDSSSDDVPPSVQPEEEEERNVVDVLSERLRMYQTAEQKAQESGETSRARRFNRGIKTLKDLLRRANAGETIPPDDIPPPIALNLKPAPPVVVAQENEDEGEEPRDVPVERDNPVRSGDDTVVSPIKFSAVDDDDVDLDDDIWEEEPPATVMEGLEQRLRIYKKLLDKAKANGDEVGVAQNEKIIRIYLNAIRTFKQGGYVDVLKLPAPRGCPPIPIPFHIP